VEVVQLPKQPSKPADPAMKRLAIQIAAQLPAKPREALLVLALAETIVRTFLADQGPI
jgi:hypothetical protein